MTTKVVSQFSATMIGHQPTTDRNAMSRKVFGEEALQVSKYLEGVHHSRKISHQQVNYASTVEKLSKLQERVPVYLQKETPKEHGVESNPAIRQHNEFMNEYIVREKHANERKRLYNREVGRTAVVDKVILTYVRSALSHVWFRFCKEQHPCLTLICTLRKLLMYRFLP